MADTTVRHFLPWVRHGTANAITTIDSLSRNQPAQVSISAKITLNALDLPPTELRLYGPGDVTALDPSQIVRMEPRPHTTTFESNLFPHIEFDRPAPSQISWSVEL
ncbi:protein of unknown function [Nitrospira japonica]|uniref:Uncharacterized protein n=1 Tax=Nitrospira japonica TaxID=1325564 RepID=A0A1W1I3H7_9BACT|nr:protein of unknown function [Nitrospira japonica]